MLYEQRKPTMRHRRKDLPSAEKAGKILKDDSVRGKKLTGRQKRFFGMLRGGGVPTRLTVSR